jgi:hypothetical protein
MAKKVEAKIIDLNVMVPYESGTTTPMRRIRIIVDGRSPLLTHNPASMGTAPEVGKGSRVPKAEDEAEAGTYRMQNGAFALKGESFRATILGAAGAWKAKRSSMKSALSHITVCEELVPLQYRDGTPIKSYAIDARRAIIQRQGIIRRRPRYDEWSCCFTVEFDPNLVVDPKLICDILSDAGGRIGVGDYRPQKNGWFGRFSVRSYQIMD